MKILLNNNHIPHSAMLLKSMPDIHFHVSCWNSTFRDLPANATFVSKEHASSVRWDLILDDDIDHHPTFAFHARRKVLLHHCEHDGGNHYRTAILKRAMDKADIVAVPSKHKIASFRELGFAEKVVELPFGFERWDLPIEKRNPTLIGCFHNCPNDEIRRFWSLCVHGFNSVMIGPVLSGQFPLGITNGYPSFVEQAARVGVYLNCVVGEAMGMAPMEAMAAGIPMVSGCAPEPWEFAFSGWNCFLSRNEPMKSIDWIRDRLSYLIENPEAARAMGEAGRATVLARFPLSNVARIFRTFIP